jgi:hypothetical protein
VKKLVIDSKTRKADFEYQIIIYCKLGRVYNVDSNTNWICSKANASTAASQPLTQISNTAATIGLTSGFGKGPGRALSLWPAYLSFAFS